LAPGSTVLTETMGGRTQYTWTPLSTAVGQIKDGRLLALAVSTAKRSPQFPDVPTIAEAGFPKAEFNFWVGMLAPAGTPREVLGKLNAEIQKALAAGKPVVIDTVTDHRAFSPKTWTGGTAGGH
jgi:tripartite-type tricarboxylate transporter receptor subunit TctC